MVVTAWSGASRLASPASALAAPQGSQPGAGGTVTATRSWPEAPASARAAMSMWGPRFAQQAFHVTGRSVPTACPIRVGTDCSGMEAPLLSMRGLRLAHQHRFSSEIKPRVRKFIEMNFGSSAASASLRGDGVMISGDMLARASEALPDVDLYVIGFPCTPFSRLRAGSSLGFREHAAKPFKKLLEVLRVKRPAVAVLENVQGIRSHLKKVWRMLAALKLYEVLTMSIDPFDMGEPVHRPRVYFLLVRVDVAVPDVDRVAAALLAAVGPAERRATVAERILGPQAASAVVLQACQRRRPAQSAALKRPAAAITPAVASLQGRIGGGASHHSAASGKAKSTIPKWKQAHAQRAVAGAVPSNLPGATERQRSLHGILVKEAAMRGGGGSSRHTVDLSQGVTRTRLLNDELPVITPGGKVWIAEQQRWLTGIEKILVHMVPISSLTWPADLTDADLAEMGGNSMHVMAVRASADCRINRSNSRVGHGSRTAASWQHELDQMQNVSHGSSSVVTNGSISPCVRGASVSVCI